MNNLVVELISTARRSMAELRRRITDVRYGNEEGNEILFDFDGQPRAARMVGMRRGIVTLLQGGMTLCSFLLWFKL